MDLRHLHHTTYMRRISAVQVRRKLHAEELCNLQLFFTIEAVIMVVNGMGRLCKLNGGDDTANTKLKHKKR